MAGFNALHIYRADKVDAVTAEKLQRYAFQSIDNMPGEEQASGWTSIDDMLDTSWNASVPEKGEWLCFALRVDKRKIPGAVLKKAYAEALKQEEERQQEQGEQYVPRSRKKELRELVHHVLMSNTIPMPATVDVALQRTSGLVLVGTASTTLLDLVVEHFQSSFGVQLTDITVNGDVQHVLQGIYAEGLQVSCEGYAFTLQEGGQVVFSNDEGTVSISAAEASCAEKAPAGVLGSIAKLKIRMEREDDPALVWMFTLTESLGISWLKLPAMSKEKGDDPDATMLEKLYLLEQLFQVLGNVFGLQVGK